MFESGFKKLKKSNLLKINSILQALDEEFSVFILIFYRFESESSGENQLNFSWISILKMEIQPTFNAIISWKSIEIQLIFEQFFDANHSFQALQSLKSQCLQHHFLG